MYYPLMDTQPFSTTADSFTYGMEGLEVSDFRLSASKPVPPVDTSKGTTPSEGSAANGEKPLGTVGPRKASSTALTTMATVTTVTPATAVITSVLIATTVATVPAAGTTATTAATPTTSTTAVAKTAVRTLVETKAVDVKPGEPPKAGTDKKKAAVDADHKKSAEST